MASSPSISLSPPVLPELQAVNRLYNRLNPKLFVEVFKHITLQDLEAPSIEATEPEQEDSTIELQSEDVGEETEQIEPGDENQAVSEKERMRLIRNLPVFEVK
jgi:hypothetical protein